MRYTVIFLLFIFSIPLYSTEQIRDKIVYEGEEYILEIFLLRSYFEENPDLYPESNVQSTDLWRGYIAEFTISDGAMYITDIIVRYYDEEYDFTFFTSILRDIFPESKPVIVDWLDSEFVFKLGDSKYRKVLIEKGLVIIDKDVSRPSSSYIKTNSVNFVYNKYVRRLRILNKLK